MGTRSKRISRLRLGLLAIGALGMVCGCAPPPVSVEGAVTLDGTPVNEAVVMFIPLDYGHQKTGALITEGNFSLPAKDGLLPGKYRVEIVDAPPLTSVPHDPVAAAQYLKKRRLLPPRYAHQSPFEIEIAAGAQSPVSADYKLTSKPP